MSDEGDARRRWIRAAKIGLPLAALGVFASLFIFSNARYADGISFEGVDLSALEEGLRLVEPSFTGATNRGEPFTVDADWALPDGPRPERVELSGVRGEIRLVDDRNIVLRADMGVLEPKANILTLTEGVRFASSDGYEINASRARIDANDDSLVATGGVTATGPIGQISAERLRATRKTPEGADAGVRKGAYIWFENRVKVRIDQPKLAQD